MVLDLRAKAKAEKNWAVSDQIRDALLRLASKLRIPRTVLRGNLTDKVQALSAPTLLKATR